MTQQDLIAAARLTEEFLKLPGHEIMIKHVRKGRNFQRKYAVSIPFWVLHRPEVYGIYYAVHEICHSAAPRDGHGKLFKTIERRALAQFGIEIVYSRAYPKRLMRNGETEYTRETKRRPRRSFKDSAPLELIKIDP